MKLDYSLQSTEDRLALVNQLLAEDPNPSSRYLEVLSDYLAQPSERAERKQRKILTENRLSTINKRETSFEGLISQFENGEDGIYNLLTNDKNQIFRHKVQITPEDIEEIPHLKQIREAISHYQKILPTLKGREAYIAKTAIIELSKDQYVLKNAFRKPTITTHASRASHPIPLDSVEEVRDGEIYYSGVSLLDPKVCSAILCNYSKLKANGDGNFISDTWFLMESFDAIASTALAAYPYYERLVEYKVDGLQNSEIQMRLQQEFGLCHSLEYISSLWRNKIPKLIAQQAQEEFLDYWYLTVEKGEYKKCSRCGQIKLANNRYFSKNTTSKDGYYSLCKDCRNRKEK